MEVFDKYYVHHHHMTVSVIKAKHMSKGWHRYGYILHPLFFVIAFGILLFAPLNFIDLPLDALFTMKLVLFIVLFILFRPAVQHFIEHFSDTLLILDRHNHVVTSILDNHKIHFGDIDNVTVIETIGPSKPVYALNFHLKEGEKASAFAFSKIHEAKKLVDVIKKNIKTS